MNVTFAAGELSGSAIYCVVFEAREAEEGFTTVLQTEPVMKLQHFAKNNQPTHGKFTILRQGILEERQ